MKNQRKALSSGALIAVTLIFSPDTFTVHSLLSQVNRGATTTPSYGSLYGADDEHDHAQENSANRQMAARRTAALNTQRQQQLENDTGKLLELAQQLKAEVDKTDKNTLSITVVKKAEEIEKLAKSIKNKMKGSV